MGGRACFFVFFMAPAMICSPIPLIFAFLSSHGSISVLIGTIFSFLSSICYLILVCYYLSAEYGHKHDEKISFPKRWSLIGLFYCICFGLQIGLQLSNDCSFEVSDYFYRENCRWGDFDVGGNCGARLCCKPGQCLRMKTLGLILIGSLFALSHLFYMFISICAY